MHPLLIFGYEVAIFEFSLVFVLLLATFVIKILFKVNVKNELTISKKIEFILLKCMREKKHIDLTMFKKNLINLKLLLRILEKNNLKYKTEQWERVRLELLVNIMVPSARIAIQKKHKLDLLYATEILTMYATKEDEALLETITYEDLPVAYLNAARVGIIYGFKKLIYRLIYRLANASWLYEIALSYSFKDGCIKTQEIVVGLLNIAHEPKIKTTCYDILLMYPATYDHTPVMEDLSSSYLDLKLAAIKYYTHIQQQEAIPTLINLLNSDQKQVKLVTLHRLYFLKAQQALPGIIKCLKDPEWSVRISAAKAIAHIDKQGTKIIQDMAPDLNIYLSNLPYIAGMSW